MPITLANVVKVWQICWVVQAGRGERIVLMGARKVTGPAPSPQAPYISVMNTDNSIAVIWTGPAFIAWKRKCGRVEARCKLAELSRDAPARGDWEAIARWSDIETGAEHKSRST